jgi:hypothetical protein
MLEFLKNAQKGTRMISKSYRSVADYGKKTVILSCDPATLGDNARELKWEGQRNLSN